MLSFVKDRDSHEVICKPSREAHEPGAEDRIVDGRSQRESNRVYVKTLKAKVIFKITIERYSLFWPIDACELKS